MDLSREKFYNPLATDLHNLFESCKEIGFTDEQAFELTKTYCSMAFATQAIYLKQKEEERIRKLMSRRRYSNSTMEEIKE